MDSVISIIPARGGSKSIPKKNIYTLNGHPLIAYAITLSKCSKYISRTIVSTDCEEIAEIAKLYGAEVPFLRPKEISLDYSTDIEFFNHASKWFLDNENYEPEYMVHLRTVCPIRNVHTADYAIKSILENKKATSLRSVQDLDFPICKMFNISDKGFLEGLCPDYGVEEYYNLPRQVFSRSYIPNSYIDVIKRSTLMNGSLHGSNILPFVTEKSIDLDSKDQLEYLEFQAKHNKDIEFLTSEMKI